MEYIDKGNLDIFPVEHFSFDVVQNLVPLYQWIKIIYNYFDFVQQWKFDYLGLT